MGRAPFWGTRTRAEPLGKEHKVPSQASGGRWMVEAVRFSEHDHVTRDRGGKGREGWAGGRTGTTSLRSRAHSLGEGVNVGCHPTGCHQSRGTGGTAWCQGAGELLGQMSLEMRDGSLRRSADTAPRRGHRIVPQPRLSPKPASGHAASAYLSCQRLPPCTLLIRLIVRPWECTINTQLMKTPLVQPPLDGQCLIPLPYPTGTIPGQPRPCLSRAAPQRLSTAWVSATSGQLLQLTSPHSQAGEASGAGTRRCGGVTGQWPTASSYPHLPVATCPCALMPRAAFFKYFGRS